MVRLSQGCTPTQEKLTLFDCGGSREQFLVTLTVIVRIDKTTTKEPL
jgi:hypothetical protein